MFNFQQHPIAPVGAKVLTWDSPNHRGTWADHGVEAVYLGPAEDHLRAFEVWVPNTSAPRITNTVWWFLHDNVAADAPLLDPEARLAYPPSKDRPTPRDNGSDLIGRAFFEPELGVCIITGLGPVVHNQMSSRGRRQRHRAAGEPIIATGAHFTLMYKQTTTGEEHYSSLTEILNWIEIGPLLQPPVAPVPTNQTEAPITTPSFVPASVQYVSSAVPQPRPAESAPKQRVPAATQNPQPDSDRTTQIVEKPLGVRATTDTRLKKVSNWTEKRVSLPRQAKSATTIRPYAYNVTPQSCDEPLRPRTARVLGLTGESSESPDFDPLGLPSLASDEWPTLSPWDEANGKAPHPPGFTPIPYPFIPNESIDDESDRFIQWVEDSERRLQRSRRTPLFPTNVDEDDLPPASGSAFTTATIAADTAVSSLTPNLMRLMPKAKMTPVFPSGPLNLNKDGTEINYRKSHAGPHADYWANADGEEIERLFTTGTMKPILFHDIPADRIITYVNPVCVEKQNDDGSMKFRTRLTIGGDRIAYPFDTTAVTAEMESLKILLNCMISEHANWSTMDLTDFYLGTDLPHPEYIRIPLRLIPANVIDFYDLQPFISGSALFCSIHKTHYGLPQAGALSQQRLFRHLAAHGYHPIPSSPSVFRNRTGTIRFTLVVDDFAVVWTDRECMDHFIHTLTELYQVKVNWLGSKYLGMDITINRDKHHVTLSMPGYVDKLLRKVRPEGIKSANTPAHYTPPNYSNPGAHTATVDVSPLASDTDKKTLQSVIGTLLYYSRAVDPSICTALHELGSIQSKPTQNDMLKMNRLLGYVSKYRNIAIRYHASNMILQLLSDASYLCRPKARSVYGTHAYLGEPDMINGPIACASKMINSVLSSVAEAELCGGFKIAQDAVWYRRVLHDLGYPQPPTLLRMDNTVAIGLALGTINQKRSKAMDMRFFWIVDRIKQKQFIVQHIPGKWNLADHFTKPLPKHKFYQFMEFIAINLDKEIPLPKLQIKTVTFPKRL
jgi:hypothetical protein